MLVVALGDLGDRYVELRGDEVDAFIDEAVTGFPDATPPSYGIAAVPLAAASDAERLASPIDHVSVRSAREPLIEGWV